MFESSSPGRKVTLQGDDNRDNSEAGGDPGIKQRKEIDCVLGNYDTIVLDSVGDDVGVLGPGETYRLNVNGVMAFAVQTGRDAGTEHLVDQEPH